MRHGGKKRGTGSNKPLYVEALESRVLLSGSGLFGQYYNGGSLSGTGIIRDDPNINFSWSNGAPDNSMPVDGYSAQWTGQIVSLYTQTYTFNIQAQGGARLYVNNMTTPIINQWAASSGSWNGTFAMTAGTKYNIKVQYAEKSTTNAGIVLSWSSASQPLQVVPQAQLYVFSDGDVETSYPGNSSYNPTTSTLTVNGGSKQKDWIVPNNIGHFVTQSITGDVQIVARLTSASANSFAGITIQDGLSYSAAAMRAYRMNTGAIYTGGYHGAGTIPLPVWFKIIRIGSVFTAYTSTDGQAWQIAPTGTGQTLSTNATLNVGFFVSSNILNSPTLETATFDNISITSPKLDYITSWVGNSGSGIDNKHVQNDIKGMYIASDGTIYTNSPWDEGGYEAAIYKNGQIVGGLLDTNGGIGSLHGWGRSGGFAIGADANYVYLGMSQNNPGWSEPDSYPESGQTWNCIRRYSRTTNRVAPFTGGAGADDSMLIVNTSGGAIRGIWVSGGNLYVADKNANLVKVYRTSDLALLSSFAVPSPQQITEDSAGNLWVISNPSSGSPSILSYSKAGVLQSKSITDVPVPTSIYVNPANGQLLVADDGPSQQFYSYNISGTTPSRVSTLGEYGGVSAGTPGVVTPTKFDNPMAVGADGAGNIYVTFDGIAPKWTSAIGLGLVIRSFSPAYTLNWELHGLEFVDSAVADPTTDGLTLYTKDEQWSLNYNTTSGEMGTWVSRTVDENVYPSDGRVTGGDTNVLMPIINGQKFMYATGQSGGGWNIYKQVSGNSLWTLCGGVSPSGMWHDLNNNGVSDPGESAKNNIIGEIYSSYVDSLGNVWFVGFNQGIYKATFTGLDASGNPIYNANYAKSTVSTDYWNVGRVIYIPETDTMYLCGFNAAYPNPGEDPRGAGCVLTRYDHWSTAATQTWRYVLPTDRTASDVSAGNVVNSLALAGNRLFVGIGATASCYAFEITTGQLVSVLYRGPEIGGQGGWLDNIQGITAIRRSNGEYVVFAEDDLLAKIIIYRAGGITPSNLTATTVTPGSINLTWGDTNSKESGSVIQQSTDGVNFTTIATLPANMTSYGVSGLTTGTPYYFRIKATNAFEDSPYSTAVQVLFATGTAPTNFVATGDTGQINLTWTDNATNETAYKVERATNAAFTTGLTTFTLAANSSGYVNTGLPAISTYYYRVYAVNGGTNLGYSQTVSATTLQVLPAIPSGLQAAVTSATSIVLSWTDNSTNEVGFQIQRATDPNFTQNLSQIIYTTANLTTYTDSVGPNTVYYYRIRSNNSSGSSSYSSAVSATTGSGLPVYPNFASTSGLLVKGTGGFTPTTSGTALRMLNNATNLATSAWWNQAVNITQFSTSFSFLISGANNADGFTFAFQNNPTNATTIPLGGGGSQMGYNGIPHADALKFNIWNGGALGSTMGWFTNGTGTTTAVGGGVNFHAGHVINVILSYSGSTLTAKLTDATNAALTTTVTYSDVNLATDVGSSTAYVGFTAGDGGATSTIDITNWSYQTLPNVPSNLTATTVSSSQINLAWTAIPGTTYNIYRSTTPGGEGSTPYATGLATNSYSNTGLTAGATYYYTVAAVNIVGTSSQTAEIAASSLPAAPLGLTATPASQTQINLSWSAVNGATSYNIYRATTPGGEGTTPLASGITTTSFSSSGLTANQTYYYKVAAVNTGGTGSQSTEASAKTKSLAPTVATAASAILGSGYGTPATLAVLGADDNGEAGLIYTWSVTSKPAGAADPVFSINGTNAAKNSVATFSQNGSYTFRATITDADGQSVTSDVVVNVTFGLTGGITLGSGGAYILTPSAGNAYILHITAGIVNLNSDLGNTVSLDLAAGTQASLNTTQHLGTVTVATGAVVSLAQGGNLVLSASNLTFAGTGKLDLADNALILTASDQTALRTYLANGQLYSSLITGQAPINGIGYLGGSDYRALHPDYLLSTQSVQETDVVAKYTLLGDVDLNGQIAPIDYAQLDASYLVGGNLNAFWVNGDFDYNHLIEAADYVAIDRALASQPHSQPLAQTLSSQHAARLGAAYTSELANDTATTFVENLYQMVLQRPADSAGEASWISALNNHTLTPAQVAAAFTGSTEYRANRVRNLYQTILGRSADAAGLAGWLSSLAAGNTLEQVTAGFYGSAEYASHLADRTPQTLIQSYYQRFLGRAAEEAGLASWVQKLNAGTSAAQIAYAIMVSSEEGAAYQVRSTYQSVLQRTPTTPELQGWLTQLRSGTSAVVLLTDLLGSTEYYTQA